jgi:hypothetical protein
VNYITCVFCKPVADGGKVVCPLDKDLDGYGCTREQGHDGKCVACGAGEEDHDIIGVYKDEDA